MDIKNMTDGEKRKRIEELKKEMTKVKADHDFFKAMNLALKLVLNGSYGAFCHPAFSVSNTNIANSITASAREVIIFMLDHIEEYFYNHWHEDKSTHNILGSNYISKGEDGKYYYHRPDGKLVDKFGRDKEEDIFKTYHLEQKDIVENDKKEFILDKKYEVIKKIFIWDFSDVRALSHEYLIPPDTKSNVWDETRGVFKEPIIIYGDTDSVISSTSISYENGKSSIEELYNKNIENGSAGETSNGHESVNCKEKVLNYDKEKGLYYAPVKRIIRHKVTKPKWCLKTKSGKEIIVTNDHSMIVFRDRKQIEIKPCNILNTDKILCVK